MASPLDERTVGNAPYEEALAKAQARNLRGGGIHLSNIIERLGQRQRLLAALGGMGAFKQDQPLGANILSVLGGVARTRLALDQQASLDKYRAEQQAMADQKAAATKPQPAPDPLLDLKRQHLQARIESERARAEQLRAPRPAKPQKPAKPPKPVAEVKLPAEVRTGLRIIRMMDPNNPEHAARLRSLILNPPSEEERRAAETKLNQVLKVAPHPGLP